MTTLVCPKCGKRSDTVRFIEAFCVDCYPLNLKVPEGLAVEKCKRCGRMKLRGEWMPYSEAKMAAQITGKCRGEFSGARYDFARQAVVFTIDRKEAGKVEAERGVPLEINITICPDCSKMSGGYYEAIIQLRGDPKRIEKQAALIMKRLVRKTFITKTEEKDEGIDIYAGNSKEVVELMGDLGIRTLMSKKLVGRDEGKRLYRTTFLIRL